MIFVTVGTHEQPFNRLIQKVDELKRDGIIKDDVVMQTGFSTYEPKYCKWSKLIPYQQMVKNVADTGLSAFLAAVPLRHLYHRATGSPVISVWFPAERSFPAHAPP